MRTKITKWGDSQGIALPSAILQLTHIEVNEYVELVAQNDSILIKPARKQPLEWYLESYGQEDCDRFEWDNNEPKGRELL